MPPAEPKGTGEQSDRDRFADAVRKILTVKPSDIHAKDPVRKHKASRQRKPKTG
jgi:hypothetical protein